MESLQAIGVASELPAPAADTVPKTARDTSLDALRGLAALQVLFLHFFAAFVPALAFASATDSGPPAWIALSPIGFLWDGKTAVAIFFVLSGYVLTQSFSRPASIVAHVVSRWVRLVLPALAACLFSAALLAIFGHVNLRAADVLHSAWLRDLLHVPDGNVRYFLKDALLSSWLIGYFPNGPAYSLGFSVHTLSSAYDAVLWTLSLEFFGSMIVLALSRLRGRVWWAAVIVSWVFFIRSYYWPFIAGHVLAAKGRGLKGRMPASVATVLLAAGIWICHTQSIDWQAWFARLNSVCPKWFFADTQDPHNKALGGIIIFIAVLGSHGISSALASPRLRLLGEMSFSLYLVHFPIVLVLGSKIFLMANPVLGLAPARYLAVAIGLPATFGAAYLFRYVDRLSILWSRAIRKAPKPGVRY